MKQEVLVEAETTQEALDNFEKSVPKKTIAVVQAIAEEKKISNVILKSNSK